MAALLRSLNQHLFEPALTLAEIERAAGLLDHNITYHFTRHVGLSPRAYRHLHRMALAQRLLRHPGLRAVLVTRIALAVGYERLDSFTRAFRQHTGMSPGRYRKAT
ncbi:MAG: hypothetical protein KatS3mg043_0540 [Rhodothermaceae bacterium]|nr:MAG: hypothetical protein KatS3mg043_0540 [Rhodothermaceae bacterium]